MFCNVKVYTKYIINQHISNQENNNLPPVPSANVFYIPNSELTSMNQRNNFYGNPPSSSHDLSTQFFMPGNSAFLITTALFANPSERLWIMDSGCSQTCVLSLEGLNVYKFLPPSFNSVHVVNGTSLPVSKEACVKIPWISKNGNANLTVLELPSLKYNFISIAQLRDIGFTTEFSRDNILVKEEHENVVAEGSYKEGLPNLNQLVQTPPCLHLSTNSSWWSFSDWHQYFGHLGKIGTRNALKAHKI